MRQAITEMVEHFSAEIDHNKLWAEQHRRDGHVASAAHREAHIVKLTRWVVALQLAEDELT